MTLLIIDADTPVFKACCIAEKTVYDILPLELQGIPTEQVVDVEDYEGSYQQYVIQSFSYVADYKKWLKEIGKDKENFLRISRTVMEPLSHALHVLDRMMRETIKAVDPEQVLVLLTGTNNFRDEVAKLRPYKENRKDKPKPYYYEAARKYLIDRYHAKVIDGCEADDMCSIVAASCQASNDPYVVAHIDKDLNSIPGVHYNYDKKTWYNVSVHEAEHWFFVQVLTGDSTDCIPGLKGVGEVGANKILGKAKSYETMQAKVIAAYQETFVKDKKTTKQLYAGYKTSHELLIEMATLVHMQRYVGEMWEITE